MTINLNTVKAMMKDEKEASEEYYKLSKKEENLAVRKILIGISKQEAEHYAFWKTYCEVAEAKKINPIYLPRKEKPLKEFLKC